jgi:hypothetical protein
MIVRRRSWNNKSVYNAKPNIKFIPTTESKNTSPPNVSIISVRTALWIGVWDGMIMLM